MIEFFRTRVQRVQAIDPGEGHLHMIVGLGNPGPEYVRNRHNVGFQIVDVLAERHQIAFDKFQKRARVGVGRISASGGQPARAVLAKPMTFMNASGEAVGPVAAYYRIEPVNLLVVCDDLDLPAGRIRLRPNGGAGGQRGLQSIIRQLGSDGFPRLRVGIGRPPGQMEPADYVLQNFSQAQAEEMAIVRLRAVDAIEAWLFEGIENAMNRFNAE